MNNTNRYKICKISLRVGGERGSAGGVGCVSDGVSVAVCVLVGAVIDTIDGREVTCSKPEVLFRKMQQFPEKFVNDWAIATVTRETPVKWHTMREGR